jgi:hypothetical protein
MNLKEVSEEIKTILEEKRKHRRLSFVEQHHIYYMMDQGGQMRSGFPSVSKLIKKFYKPFDAQGISWSMAKGDEEEQKRLLAEWAQSGKDSVNLGSRVHYELEKYIIEQYDNYKKVRQPEFVINEGQKIKSDKMIQAGIDFIKLMHDRGAVLLDTEMILGDAEEGFVGSPDNTWLMLNREQTDFGFVITDHKSGQPKNFEVFPYTGKLYSPFEQFHDNALGHYYLQIPLYGRLLTKMLKGSKYEDKKFLGGVIVLMKEDATFAEYKVPQYIISTILTMDLKPFLK